YQGRFKSFPVEKDDHYVTLCRYVERNALRANLVERAEAWRWGSLAQRQGFVTPGGPVLEEGPVEMPRNWVKRVNGVETEGELRSLRRSVERGQPFGNDEWIRRTATRLGLESTMRPRGRPKKKGS